MKYWLLKSEPSAFSIDDLAKKPNQTTLWDGVRNYQARNLLRDELKTNDLAFFYHSSCDVPGIAGVMKIVKAGYPDPTQAENSERWYAVDVKLIRKFSQIISLSQLRENLKLQQMVLLRKGNRLSVMPVTLHEWQSIFEMTGEDLC